MQHGPERAPLAYPPHLPLPLTASMRTPVDMANGGRLMAVGRGESGKAVAALGTAPAPGISGMDTAGILGGANGAGTGGMGNAPGPVAGGIAGTATGTDLGRCI